MFAQLSGTSCIRKLYLKNAGDTRNRRGCGDHLEEWFKEQYILFLLISLVIVLVEFAVLLSTILACTKLYKHQHEEKAKAEVPKPPPKEKVFVSGNHSPFSYSNHAYSTSNSFRHNYGLSDKA